VWAIKFCPHLQQLWGKTDRIPTFIIVDNSTNKCEKKQHLLS